LADVKCQHLVLRALARIRQEPDLANAHAVLVGDGPERESLTRLAQELGLAEVVHLTGFQEQREKYYQLMDVFLLTSRSEAMPLVVLEAWAAGVPVIATAVGGIPEMIAHETTGVVVPVGDIEAIVTATLRLLRNREEARTMVAAASAEVHSRYSVQTMVEEYQRKYWNVIESKAGAAVR
jgi:glycosyltransferase involved in cell wall biosynthesis